MATPPEPSHIELFPTLTPAQIERLRPFATERRFADGDSLWEQGDRDRSMFIVLEGEIAILSGSQQIVAVHEPGEFTGDVDLLSGRPVVVRAHARGATRVLELASRRLRDVVQTDPELMEIFLHAFMLRRAVLVRAGGANVVLIGSLHSAGTHALQEFLTRNNQPYAYMDVDRDPEVQSTLDGFGLGVDDVPVLVCRGTRVLKKPTIEQAAECLGLNVVAPDVVRDLIVIGAGPAGFAAAVYAASEGLDVLVVEANAPGGQAGSSSRIENYLGFPTGISGQDLAARALVQAEKFGAEIVVARTATRLECGQRPYRVDLGSDVVVTGRTVIIATGVRYRRPALPDLARFEGMGVYYSATPIEASLCRDEDVIVVGGGNSAGQAAVFLSGHSRRVHMLVRGPGLAASMSRYLIRRIEETTCIDLRTQTQVDALHGQAHLERVTWRDGGGERTTVDVRHIFLMTGADPNTQWLRGCVALDDKGFVKAGQDLREEDLAVAGWPLARPPYLFETSLPGVFVVGDARANSVKRVAAAVGEGSVCVQLVHKALAE